MWQRTRVSADRGGKAAGRDLYHIEISSGISPDQFAVIVDILKREQQLTDEQRQTITSLETKLGVSEAALLAFFRTLGEANVSFEQLETRLIEIGEDYNRVRGQVAAAPGDPPEIAKLKTEAGAALDAGELKQADDLLKQVLAAEDAAIEKRQLEAAQTSAQRGGIALTRLRYREAAEHFASAAKRVPPKHQEQALAYLAQEAEAFYRQGGEFDDNQALVEGIERFRALLALTPRSRVPLDWAATQNNLGVALRTLGQWEPGTRRLEEAVEAYRAALEEYTRDRVPLQWATTQNNLGNALRMLGQREKDARKLKEARGAVSAAFEVFLQAGQEHYRAYFENRLREIDAAIAGLEEKAP